MPAGDDDRRNPCITGFDADKLGKVPTNAFLFVTAEIETRIVVRLILKIGVNRCSVRREADPIVSELLGA